MREMNGPLKGTPHVDYCLLTVPGVCVHMWDLMCSSTFVQGVVITVVTVHTYVCFIFTQYTDGLRQCKICCRRCTHTVGVQNVCVTTRTRHSAV